MYTWLAPELPLLHSATSLLCGSRHIRLPLAPCQESLGLVLAWYSYVFTTLQGHFCSGNPIMPPPVSPLTSRFPWVPCASPINTQPSLQWLLDSTPHIDDASKWLNWGITPFSASRKSPPWPRGQNQSLFARRQQSVCLRVLQIYFPDSDGNEYCWSQKNTL